VSGIDARRTLAFPTPTTLPSCGPASVACWPACRISTTPAEIAGPVRRLLALLRLRYAALDFAVDRNGRWWFLEVNPNGQWLWIEHATGLPIAAAVATALAARTSNG
jgi:hypothetical protein